MDSIRENVTAILCVVVGLLIIGTALVPIVEHSSETQTIETISGENEASTGTPWIIPLWELETELELTTADTVSAYTIKKNGTNEFAQVVGAYKEYFVLNATAGSYSHLTVSPSRVTVSDKIDGSGPSEASETGDDFYVWSNSKVYNGYPRSVTYGWIQSGEAKLGSNQHAYAIQYTDFDESTQSGIITITPFTAATAPEGITVTENADGSLTLSGEYYLVPLEWVQETTSTETSGYAALYAVIPIMCILAMAFVLIRRL